MSKKGSERLLIYITIMTLLGLAAGIAFLSEASNFLDDTTYWKIYYAKDLGLLMDAGLAGRGNIEINYDTLHSNKPIAVHFFPDHVEVFDYNPQVKEKIPATFRFGGSNKIEVENKEINSSSFDILISEDKVNFSKEILKQETCSKINTTKNASNVTVYVESANDAAAAKLKSELSDKGFKIVESAEGASLSLVLQELLDWDYMITVYNEENAFVHKMICEIRNSILQQDEEAFFIEKKSQIDPSLTFPEITEAQIGLIIQIHGLDDDTAAAIAEGVMSYYG